MRLRKLITVERADAALARLIALPVTVVRSKPLLSEAWAMRDTFDGLLDVIRRHGAQNGKPTLPAPAPPPKRDSSPHRKN